MFPSILLCSSNVERKRKKKKAELESSWRNLETGTENPRFSSAVPFYANPIGKTTTANLSLSSDHYTPGHSFRGSVKLETKAKKKGEAIMSKVSNFSDLIQRVTASCLLHPLAADRHLSGEIAAADEEVYEYETDEHEHEHDEDDDDDEDDNEEENGRGFGRVWEGTTRTTRKKSEEVLEMEAVMVEVFEAAAAMKKAYVRLQEAHCPWDADKMRTADAAVVAEMRRIGVLRERFRRSGGVGGGGGMTAATVREVVAPYEAAVEELRREVKARDAEVETLKEKLKSFAAVVNGGGGGKKGRSLSRKKVSCIQAQGTVSPSPEIFEMTMSKVNEGLKSFTSLLLSLMRTAQWDIAAAVRSIEAASSDGGGGAAAMMMSSSPGAVTGQHAKYALESYVSRKVFQGFDHETFYMDGSLSSLLNPEQFRRECFTQYRDMKAMDPAELLGILPTCNFGKFCSKRYLSLVHPKMEESLFGNLDQHRQVSAGSHPRSHFYAEFLHLAKAVWLLHLLAFSLDPPPSQFEASRGADFHPLFMDSVVKLPGGGRLPPGLVVGLPVSPGFKISNGSVVKARVYLVSSRS